MTNCFGQSTYSPIKIKQTVAHFSTRFVIDKKAIFELILAQLYYRRAEADITAVT